MRHITEKDIEDYITDGAIIKNHPAKVARSIWQAIYGDLQKDKEEEEYVGVEVKVGSKYLNGFGHTISIIEEMDKGYGFFRFRSDRLSAYSHNGLFATKYDNHRLVKEIC